MTIKRQDTYSRYKPAKFKHYLTIGELAAHVERTVDWLKRLEKEDRLPVPTRAEVGVLSVRLYSPQQVAEVEQIIANMRPGPKPKGG